MPRKHHIKRGGLAICAVGLLILMVGTGPFLVEIALGKLGMIDPNLNDVLFGMMAMFTFWPGIGITAVGIALAFAGRKGPGLEGKACPSCAEPIRRDALACGYCGKQVPLADARAAGPTEKWRCPKCGFSNAGNSFICGMCKYVVV